MTRDLTVQQICGITVTATGQIAWPIERVPFERYAEFATQFKNTFDMLERHRFAIKGQIVKYGVQNYETDQLGPLFANLDFNELEVHRGLQLIEHVAPNLRSQFPDLSERHWLAITRETKDPVQIEHWAKEAAQRKLTPQDVQYSVRMGRTVTTAEQRNRSGNNAGIMTLQAAMLDYRRWKQRIGGKNGLLSAEPETQAQWLQITAELRTDFADIEEHLMSLA